METCQNDFISATGVLPGWECICVQLLQQVAVYTCSVAVNSSIGGEALERLAVLQWCVAARTAAC